MHGYSSKNHVIGLVRNNLPMMKNVMDNHAVTTRISHSVVKIP